MKAFIIALAVFVTVCSFVVCSSVYLTRGTDSLISLAEALPDDTADDRFGTVYADISSRWDGIRGAVRCFAGHVESDLVEDALDELTSRHESGDGAGYLAAKTKLISQLDRIKSAEKFTCDSLF